MARDDIELTAVDDTPLEAETISWVPARCAAFTRRGCAGRMRRGCDGCTRRGCAAGCCGGLLVGGLLALFVSFLVAAADPCIFLPIALLTQVVLFVVLLIACPVAGCCIACRANRRPRLLKWMQRDRPKVAAVAALSALLLACVVALSVPSLARHKLFVVFGSVSELVLYPHNPLPAGYCDEVAETWRTGGWLGNVSGDEEAERLAATLVGNMTEAEKLRLVQGHGWNGWQGPAPGFFMGTALAIPRLGIPSMNAHDAGQGFRPTERRQVGQTTSWPCTLAVASTWDAALVGKWGGAVAAEYRAKGANVLLGPGLDVQRVQLNGRAAESLAGEEPALGATLVRAYVAAVQGGRVAAVAKHFSLYTQESDRGLENPFRDGYSSDASARTRREVHFPPVAAAVEAGIAAVMCSYNRANGSYACESQELLDQLKATATTTAGGGDQGGGGGGGGGLGFSGWVMSDWWAVGRSCATPAQRGLDQNMPGNDHIFDAEFLRAKGLTEEGGRLDDMATRVLRGMLRANAYADPPCVAPCDCDTHLYEAVATSAAHLALARELGAAALVLLKNDDGVLPLRSGARVALVGSACDAAHDLDKLFSDYAQGDYYVVGGSGRVVSDAAVSVEVALADSPSLELAAISRTDDIADAAAAMAAATASGASLDAVIACGGAHASESYDRSSLRLDQHDFLREVAALSARPPLVVLAMAPGPILTSPWAAQAGAVLSGFLLGQQTGAAFADVLTGDVSPSGRLPVTFPESEGQGPQPCWDLTCPFDERLLNGWRALHGSAVAFPFGHGLSYTSFVYAWATSPQGAALSAAALQPAAASAALMPSALALSVAVSNAGAVAGREVVQLYLEFPASAGEPPLVLRAFGRTGLLQPGASELVQLDLSAHDLAVWDDEGGAGWLPATGEYVAHVGASSRDLRLDASFEVVA